jgi:hypothetical protein
MRTAMIILGGIAIWAVSLGLARRFGKPGGDAVADTTLAFITIWFLAAATNLWVGVAQAGYTVREELPIMLAIFGVPAGIAALVKWRYFPAAPDLNAMPPADGTD